VTHLSEDLCKVFKSFLHSYDKISFNFFLPNRVLNNMNIFLIRNKLQFWRIATKFVSIKYDFIPIKGRTTSSFYHTHNEAQSFPLGQFNLISVFCKSRMLSTRPPTPWNLFSPSAENREVEIWETCIDCQQIWIQISLRFMLPSHLEKCLNLEWELFFNQKNRQSQNPPLFSFNNSLEVFIELW